MRVFVILTLFLASRVCAASQNTATPQAARTERDPALDGTPTLPEAAGRRAGYSIQMTNGSAWLFKPDGRRFFSLGVCCLEMASPRDGNNPTNRVYSAWNHYSSSNQWVQTTVQRLKSWGFTTAGGWSDYPALQLYSDTDLAMTPVLHMGSTAGAPWWDLWDPKVINRMDQVAREQILPLRNDPRVLGYYSDNELGWWNAALFRMTLEQAPASGQRARLMTLLREHYHQSWASLLEDFEPAGATDWQTLEKGGGLYLRPGGNGLKAVQRFVEVVAERYYSLVRQIIRKYDSRALVLGDRYQSFFYPEVARASARYVDASSSNLNAGWNDGTFPHFYLDTLHALTGRPILVSEFYMAARENRTGNRNSRGEFPVTTDQQARAAASVATLRALTKLPYVVGADWFQYFDEPPYGRYDGEDFNFGLVDIDDRPYEELTKAAASLDLTELKTRSATTTPNASSAVPPAPPQPFAQFGAGAALKEWDRQGGFVPPDSACPLADLYLSWSPTAIYAGLYVQDVVDPGFYRDQVVPEIDRSLWTVSIKDSEPVLSARIGAGLPPTVSGRPGVRLENLSGVNLKVRNVAALELPAELFGQKRFRAGDRIRLSSSLVTLARGYRIDWSGEFTLGERAGPGAAPPPAAGR